MNLIFLNYNNYYNRIIKKFDTKQEYEDACELNQEFYDIQFNPNDGVYAEQIVNWRSNTWTPDYMLYFDEQEDKILSRWFVLQWERTRGGQYKATLRRDVIADNYDTVIKSPVFLEKGYIDDVNNPLLYNSESMTYNQIKRKEVALQDETKSGWVVGYIPSDAFTTSKRIEKQIAVPVTANITVSDLTNWEYWQYCSNNTNFNYMADSAGRKKVDVKIRSTNMYTSGRTAYQNLMTADYSFYPNSEDAGTYSQLNTGTISTTTGSWNYPQWYANYGPVTVSPGSLSASVCNNIFNSVRTDSTFNNALNTVLGENIVIGDTSVLLALQDKIILNQSTGDYYKIQVIEASESSPVEITNETVEGADVLDALNNAMNTNPSFGVYVQGSYTTIMASNSSTSYALKLTNVGVSVYTDIDNDRLHLDDAPYDMFCIPYSDTLQLTDGNNTFTVNRNIALGIATEIAKDTGSGNVYDVQILPYCPNRSLVVGSANPSTLLDLTKVKYDLIKESVSDTPASAIIWCTESNFQINIKANTLSFTQPYTRIPDPASGEDKDIFVPNQWYIMNSASSSTTSYISFRSTDSGGNRIRAYSINTNTGEILSDLGYVARIAVTPGSVIPTLGSVNVYRLNGNTYQSVWSTLISAYNSAPVKIVFKLEQTGYYWNNITTLMNNSSIPTVSGFDLVASTDAIERKISNETDVFRLSSGNYNGIFEFSVAKSGGVDGFIADCTYKPWAPYVHIIPKLKGLYGDDFVKIDDARGLIIGGDYSLPQLTNEWANYTLNNKTYQEMFDRQIQNIDITNDINKMGAIANTIAAPITGAGAGAIAGAKAGPYGAIAGAAVGAVGGGITGGLDLANTLKLMEENKQYTKDMYGYNLQNIQAIPTSLTKTSALTYNTRVWPFLEYYNCTPEEIQALRDKIIYDGMTIMKIDKLSNYTLNDDHFYRGQLIRLLDFVDDSHIAYEIYNELEKGVYL